MTAPQRSKQAGTEEVFHSEKRRKQAVAILWFFRLGLLVSLVILADSVYHYATQPGVVTALKLLPGIGSAVMFSALSRHFRQTIRNNGIEPRNMWVGLGPPLVMAGTFLPDAYERGHWLVFYGAGVFLVLLVLAAGVLEWAATRDSEN